MTKPLLDFDILLYEIGFSSQRNEVDEAGERYIEPASWEFCQDLLDRKIELICDEVEGTQPPTLYLTNTPYLNSALNRRRRFAEEDEVEYVPNFRELVSTTGYKLNRNPVKPFHFNNLIHYAMSAYDVRINEKGLEADDQVCIDSFRLKGGATICSRDKDLRQCPGRYYGWECGKQPSIGPIIIDQLGTLVHTNAGERDSKGRKATPKIFGTGDKFFYYQLLAGDSVDTIGGIKGAGPVFAYNAIKDATSSRDCYEIVAEVYSKNHLDEWRVKFREMADLLYIIREEDEGGIPIRWKIPKRL